LILQCFIFNQHQGETYRTFLQPSRNTPAYQRPPCRWGDVHIGPKKALEKNVATGLIFNDNLDSFGLSSLGKRNEKYKGYNEQYANGYSSHDPFPQMK